MATMLANTGGGNDPPTIDEQILRLVQMVTELQARVRRLEDAGQPLQAAPSMHTCPGCRGTGRMGLGNCPQCKGVGVHRV